MDYIPISELNDFVFCPYSIYLHHVYMEADEGLYHAKPQINGKIAHETSDEKRYSTRKTVITAMSVASNTLGLIGKIDIYKQDTGQLIERKYRIPKIYRGQLYQLWGEYYCMSEMGYKINELAFHEISTHKSISIPLPNGNDLNELKQVIQLFKTFRPDSPIPTNANKCKHCIYNNLCDKTSESNVY